MKGASAPDVPVVDLVDGSGVVASLSTVGFVALREHGVAEADLSAMRELLVDLFAVDEDSKARQAITRENYRGFIPQRFFTPNRDSKAGNGTATADGFEGYKLHWECPPGHPVRNECSLYGPNRWPEYPARMQQVVASWWVAMEGLVDRLLDVLADEMGLDRSALAGAMEAPLTNTTLLHYPARSPDDLAPGFHPHKDITVVTVLDPDPVGGFEVRTRDGRWVEAACPEGALLVNVGDVLEVWSGGRLDLYAPPGGHLRRGRAVQRPILRGAQPPGGGRTDDRASRWLRGPVDSYGLCAGRGVAHQLARRGAN